MNIKISLIVAFSAGTAVLLTSEDIAAQNAIQPGSSPGAVDSQTDEDLTVHDKADDASASDLSTSNDSMTTGAKSEALPDTGAPSPDAQKALIEAQQRLIDAQSEQIEDLQRRVTEIEQRASAKEKSDASPPAAPNATSKFVPRDSVGDLNRYALQRGDFPGAFLVPGTKRTSLAIGGFIKTAAIYDSQAEGMGADFLPSNLEPGEDGAFSLDATLSKLFVDGRAPVAAGTLRAYIEFDLNAQNNGNMGFKLRHAYGSWTTPFGMLTVGHTWSTMMDIACLPEGLTEPTISGFIFMRQAVIRWSQYLGQKKVTLHFAAEDPSSADVFSADPALGKSKVPDGVLGFQIDPVSFFHLRLNGIVRYIDTKLSTSETNVSPKAALGTALTIQVRTYKKDRIVLGGVYGRGLGRYLLGIPSIAGAALNPNDEALYLNRNWGAAGAYEHHWNEKLRSTLTYGHAESVIQDWEPDDSFRRSDYASINLMWQVRPYLTLGIEYGFGHRQNADETRIFNHRGGIGIQVF